MNKLFFIIISCSVLFVSMNPLSIESVGHKDGIRTDTAKVQQKDKKYKVEFYRQFVLRASGTTTYKRTSLNIGTFSVSLTNVGDGYYNIDGTEYYLKFIDDLTPEKNKGMLDVHSGEGENNDGVYTELF
ncbi:MAG TPA: hypothetical protein VK783_13775 [Bacteroidia bacterium]|nr:hypothetical protein [Bacteroidia bacterium]